MHKPQPRDRPQEAKTHLSSPRSQTQHLLLRFQHHPTHKAPHPHNEKNQEEQDREYLQSPSHNMPPPVLETQNET